MGDMQVIGAQYGAAGSAKPFSAGTSGAQRVSDSHGKYLEAVLAGRAFSLSIAAAAPTAYVGAAAGTPLIGIYNPANSSKILSALMVCFAGRVAASAAGETGLELWSGPSVMPTGTKSNPTNMLTLAASGSAAVGFVNTAMTGSTALTNVMPLATYYWATAASALLASGLFDICGIAVAAPGNMLALGLTAVPTSTTGDVMLIWEEIPNLPMT